ncbi:MAG: hypothetical protein UHW99_03015, partial [Methanobrevibacter sp.]|nr:hypothetical protein [Methanobrevibacter sp.]
MKKMNKNIFICALLVVMMLFCVSAVSAEDTALDKLASDDSSDVISAEGDTIYVDSSSTSDDEQGTESNPYKTISSAVNSNKVTGGETIFIKNGNYSVNNTITFTKNLNLVGESKEGVSIKSTMTSSELFVGTNDGLTLSFTNLKIVDSSKTGGTGILRFTGGKVMNIDFKDCTFDNITNKYGVMQLGSTGTVNIEGCTFTNIISSVSNGAGAIYVTDGGTYNIKDTVFDNISYSLATGQVGGVIYISKAAVKLNMENVVIQNCIYPGNSIVRSTGTVDIKKSKFINNTVSLSSAGYVGDSLFYIGSSGKMTMEQSIIADNSVAKNVFYLGSSAKVTMNYNNIHDNTFNASYESGFKTNNGVVNAENNYWGSNTLPAGVTANVWVVEEDGAYKLSNGGDLEKEIPELESGEEPVVSNEIFVSPEGNDVNDGSESSPVKTIAHAIEIADGKIVLLEGTHKTADLGIISKNLTITSKGNAIIDADNNNRILYVGSDATIVIENIKMTNGYINSEESGALIGNSGNLTIKNCTLANSTSSKNGGAIYNAAYLTIIDSIFENNKASQNGGAIFTQKSGTGKIPTLTIVGTTFTDNNANGYSNFGGGAIFAQQAADGLSISNSNFTSNYVEAYGGGAIEIVNTNVAIITGCNFVSNFAHGEDSQSNYGGGAVSFIGAYSDKKETLTVSDSLFEDNSVSGVGGGAIYVRTSTVNVANSILVNNYDDESYAIYSRITSMITPSVIVNDNWWGSNDSPKSYVSEKVTLNRWAILTVENASEIKEGEDVTISANINTYTTGSTSGELAKPIGVPRDITIETSAGEIEGVLENGEFNTVYNVPAGLKYIKATVDSQTETLFMTTTATIVESEGFTAKKGERYDIVINVTSADGTVINQGYVDLFIGEESIGTIYVDEGVASDKILISMDEGKYNVTIKYTDEEGLFEENFTVIPVTVSGLNNVVTQENFFDFFDINGAMYGDIPFDELTFKGEFKDLGIGNIEISSPIAIKGNNAKLINMTVSILSPDVSIDNLAIDIDSPEDLGTALYVYYDNVSLNKVDISYKTNANTTAFGVFIEDSNNVNLTNSKITFESNADGTKDYYQYAVKVLNSNNIVMSGNTITSSLPACDVNYDSEITGIDHDLVLAIGIQTSNDVLIDNNKIYTDVIAVNGDYPTVDSIMVDDVNNLVINKNTIVQTDKSNTGNPGFSNAVDLYNFKNVNVTANNIKVESTAGTDGLGSAYPIQANGPYSGLLIDGNTLTAISNGPTLGIYSQCFTGETDNTITNNVINVTGCATDDKYSLVSGMELQDTHANIYNNTIYSQSINPYNETNRVYGISFAQWYNGDHTFDIRDNQVFTQGKYAVFFEHAVDTNVVGNDLHAQELFGNDAVIIKDGQGNLIELNTPPYGAEVIIDAPDVWVGENSTITVTVTNATTGKVTIKVNDKEFKDLELINGSVSQAIDVADIIQDDVNNVSVIYGGSPEVDPGNNATTFDVLYGVITNETFSKYFDEKGYLRAFVPEGVTLNFQGPFVGARYSLFINKPVNVITTKATKNNSGLLGANYENYDGYAIFDSGENPNYNWLKFNVVEGADHTNITGLHFVNSDLFIQGVSYVTVDNVSMIANMRGVGSGTGFVSIHSNAYYTTVKNSFFENGGTGSSVL